MYNNIMKHDILLLLCNWFLKVNMYEPIFTTPNDTCQYSNKQLMNNLNNQIWMIHIWKYKSQILNKYIDRRE